MLDFGEPPSLTSRADEYKKIFTSHQRTKEFKGHTAKVHSVGWNCEGKYLASGSFDQTVSLFAFNQSSLVRIHRNVIVNSFLVAIFVANSLHPCGIFSRKYYHLPNTKVALINCVGIRRIPNYYVPPEVTKQFVFGIPDKLNAVLLSTLKVTEII